MTFEYIQDTKYATIYRHFFFFLQACKERDCFSTVSQSTREVVWVLARISLVIHYSESFIFAFKYIGICTIVILYTYKVWICTVSLVACLQKLDKVWHEISSGNYMHIIVKPCCHKLSSSVFFSSIHYRMLIRSLLWDFLKDWSCTKLFKIYKQLSLDIQYNVRDCILNRIVFFQNADLEWITVSRFY